MLEIRPIVQDLSPIWNWINTISSKVSFKLTALFKSTELLDFKCLIKPMISKSSSSIDYQMEDLIKGFELALNIGHTSGIQMLLKLTTRTKRRMYYYQIVKRSIIH